MSEITISEKLFRHLEQTLLSRFEDQMPKIVRATVEGELKALDSKINSLQVSLDHLQEENRLQGEDLTRNTKEIALIAIDVTEMKKIVLGRTGDIVDKVSEAVRQEVADTVPSAVEMVIQPIKKNVIKRSNRLLRFFHLR